MKLYVHFNGACVAMIEGDQQIEAVTQIRPFVFSPNMQSSKGECNVRALNAFFENLMPEGYVRNEVFELSRLHANDLMGFMRIKGHDLPCGISVHPSELLSPSPKKLHHIHRSDLAKRIHNAHAMCQPIINEGAQRLSLAGAQDKLGVCIIEGEYFIPENTLSTHIIKPDSMDYPGLAVNEYFMMKFAERMGLDIPAVFFDDEINAFVIERYDRFMGLDGYASPMHQLDFCQALGLFSHEKYDHDHGHLERMKSIMKITSAPFIETQKLFKRIVFDALSGNRDGHLKNFALLYEANEKVVLAPSYDLICTDVFSGLSRTHAISLNGVQDADLMDASSITQAGVTLGLSEKHASMILDDMLMSSPHELNALALDIMDALPRRTHDMIDRVERVVQLNITSINERSQLLSKIDYEDTHRFSGF